MVYLLTGFWQHLLGEGQIVSRLPEILGFWIFCLCLYRFVSLRSCALGGFISMLFPMITLAYWYAYEARTYGVVLGFCGLALICWQAATDRATSRVGWLLGLGAALTGAMLSHSYAFLIFIPIVVGELSRTVIRRRLDWPIWATIAVSSTAALVSLPLLHSAKSSFDPTFHPASLGQIANTYRSLLGPAASVLAGWLILMCLPAVSALKTQDNGRKPRQHEMVALFTFLPIPLVAFCAAKVLGAPLFARYSVSLIAGAACLLGLAATRRPVIGIAVLLLMLGKFGVDVKNYRSSSALIEPSSGYAIGLSLQQFGDRYEWVNASPNKALPVVLMNNLDSLPTSYYAPPALASRFVYVLWSNSNLELQNYNDLQTCCQAALPSPVRASDFMASHDAFLAYGGPDDAIKLDELAQSGAVVTVQRVSPYHFLALVSRLKMHAIESEPNLRSPSSTSW
jgi:hypothetical protein